MSNQVLQKKRSKGKLPGWHVIHGEKWEVILQNSYRSLEKGGLEGRPLEDGITSIQFIKRTPKDKKATHRNTTRLQFW